MDIEQIRKAASVINQGGVVAYPTETFYGLAVNPMNSDALARLIEIKGRDAAKGIPVIAASVEVVQERFSLSAHHCGVLRKLWPAPLSIALSPGTTVPDSLGGDFNTVAIRVSALDSARQLAKFAKGMITATSANFSGEAPVTEASALDPGLIDLLDYVLDGGKTPGGLPSTIVELATGAEYRVFREGAFELSRLKNALEAPCQK